MKFFTAMLSALALMGATAVAAEPEAKAPEAVAAPATATPAVAQAKSEAKAQEAVKPVKSKTTKHGKKHKAVKTAAPAKK